MTKSLPPYKNSEFPEDAIHYESDYTTHCDFGEEKINYSQWSIVGDGSFLPSPETRKDLPPGLYEITWNNKISDWAFLKQALNTDELFELPTQEISEILGDIKKFWQKIETYKKYNLIHKRGILLYGDPGCGKSGILQLCIKHIINDLSGIVINLKDEDSIKAYAESVHKLRQIESKRPLIVIIEDIDSIAGENNYSTSVLLNILDGIKQIENVVYVATTNYPEKLEERITNRPSRFDRRYYISPPTSEVREAYIRNKMGRSKIKLDVSKWVKDTEGLSMSHLKELFISVVVLDNSYETAIAHLTGMKKAPRNKSRKEVGFTN